MSVGQCLLSVLGSDYALKLEKYMTTDLVDRIYEAAFVPEHWPSVLNSLADFTRSEGGSLLTFQGMSMNWTSSESISAVIKAYIEKGWLSQCDRRICMARNAHTEFLTEHDYWTKEQFENNYVYNELFRPMGIGFSAGTGLQSPTGDVMAIFVERRCDQGPMEKHHVRKLNELRPHLARSALMASRLGLKTAKTASQTISKLGIATILLNASGTIIESQNTNAFIDEHITSGMNDRLVIKDRLANELFKQALETLHEHSLDPNSTVRSIPIRDSDGQAAIVAHLMPVCRSALDIFSASYAVCTLIPVSTKSAPNVDLIRSLFDFTAAEAEVARSLAKGKSLNEIASERNVNVETVRTQLKRVMEKTGCKRQGELVALMVNVALR